MNSRKCKKAFNKNTLGAYLLGRIVGTPKRVGLNSWLIETPSGRAIIKFSGYIIAAELYGDII